MASGPGVYARGPVTLFQTTVRDNTDAGIFAGPGGSIEVLGGEITSNGGTGAGTNGGVLRLDGAIISGNVGTGIGVGYGGSAFLNGCTIGSNGSGAFAIGGTLVVENTTISSNAGRGIEARNVSTVKLGSSTVAFNQGDGILLDDVSFMEVSGGMTHVTNNSGWGLSCSPEPALAHCKVYSSSLSVSDNGPSGGTPTNISSSCGITP